MPENFLNDLISTIVSFLILMLSVFIVVLVLVIRYRKRKRENEQLRVDFAEQLLKSQMEIQEQTMQHVSRELHDNIGQVASLVKINLTTLKLSDEEKALAKLEDTKALVKQMMTDIKLLSTGLSGDKIVRQGLLRSLQNEADNINRTGVFTSEFTHDDNIPPVNDEKAIILFRMMQELLNNSMKYSEGTTININANYRQNALILSVADNGKGFNVKEEMDKGNGLINLQQRARVINASIETISVPGKGTSTTIKIPQ
ncbi:MAG: histidine kinase [Ferruginibacter sp.]